MALLISRVTSETFSRISSGIFFKTVITSVDFVPATMATRDPLPPFAFLLVTIV
jgi:hypothetical protein